SFIGIIVVLSGLGGDIPLGVGYLLLLIYLLNLLGFSGGILLWREDVRGVAVTQWYLMALLAISFASTIVVVGSGGADAVVYAIVRGGLSVMFLVAWLLYFRRSSRVRRTYSSGRQTAAVPVEYSSHSDYA